MNFWVKDNAAIVCCSVVMNEIRVYENTIDCYWVTGSLHSH